MKINKVFHVIAPVLLSFSLMVTSVGAAGFAASIFGVTSLAGVAAVQGGASTLGSLVVTDMYNYLTGKGVEDAPESYEEILEWDQTINYYNYFNFTELPAYEPLNDDNKKIFSINFNSYSNLNLIDGWTPSSFNSLSNYSPGSSSVSVYQALMKDNSLQILRDPTLAIYNFDQSNLLSRDRIILKYDLSDLPYAMSYFSSFQSNIFSFTEDSTFTYYCGGSTRTTFSNSISTIVSATDGLGAIISYNSPYNNKYIKGNVIYSLYSIPYDDFTALTSVNPQTDYTNWTNLGSLSNIGSFSVSKDFIYIIVANVFISGDYSESYYDFFGDFYLSFPDLRYKSSSSMSIAPTVSDDQDFIDQVVNNYISYYYENNLDINPPGDSDSDGDSTGGSGSGDLNIDGSLDLNLDGEVDHSGNVDITHGGGLDVNVNVNLPDWFGGSGSDPDDDAILPDGSDDDDSSGGSSSLLDNFLSLIGKLVEVLLKILTALLDVIIQVLSVLGDYLIDFILNLVERFISLLNTEFVQAVRGIFGWLPDEVADALVLGMLVVVLIGVIKAVKR